MPQRKQQFEYRRSDWRSRDRKSYELHRHRQRALARKVKAQINIPSKKSTLDILNVLYNMLIGISHHLRVNNGRNTKGELSIKRFKKTDIAKHMKDVLTDFGFKTQLNDESICFSSGTTANELERLSCFHKQAKLFKSHGFTQMCQGWFWTFETPTPEGANALRNLLLGLNQLIPAHMLWNRSNGFHARFV